MSQGEKKYGVYNIRMKYDISKDCSIFESVATSHMCYSKEGIANLNLTPWKVPVKTDCVEDIYPKIVLELINFDLLNMGICLLYFKMFVIYSTSKTLFNDMWWFSGIDDSSTLRIII